MSRRSLRPQLNQIRAWVRQGRTDAWIAHQLEVSASELREFRRQHDLAPDEDAGSSTEVDLRDEIEAEIEAAAAEEEATRAKAEAEAAAAAERAVEEEAGGAEVDDSDDPSSEDTESDGSEAEGRPRRRRRGRRGQRERGSANKLEGTFDHGEEGYGLWLDPSIRDLAAYKENWADKRDVVVTVEADQIIIRRAGETRDGD